MALAHEVGDRDLRTLFEVRTGSTAPIEAVLQGSQEYRIHRARESKREPASRT